MPRGWKFPKRAMMRPLQALPLDNPEMRRPRIQTCIPVELCTLHKVAYRSFSITIGVVIQYKSTSVRPPLLVTSLKTYPISRWCDFKS
jgi:hypothetical protein